MHITQSLRGLTCCLIVSNFGWTKSFPFVRRSSLCNIQTLLIISKNSILKNLERVAHFRQRKEKEKRMLSLRQHVQSGHLVNCNKWIVPSSSYKKKRKGSHQSNAWCIFYEKSLARNPVHEVIKHLKHGIAPLRCLSQIVRLLLELGSVIPQLLIWKIHTAIEHLNNSRIYPDQEAVKSARPFSKQRIKKTLSIYGDLSFN